MSAHRKTRADSTLGMLPEDRQMEIAEHAAGNTLDATVTWLREDGVKVSRSALSLWLSDFRMRQVFKMAESDALNFVELLRKKRPELSESELQGWANEFFQVQAVKIGDAKTYLRFATARHKAEMDRLNFEQRERGLKQKEDSLRLEREKFEFDAAESCLKQLPELRTIANNAKTSHSDKIQQIRERLFGSLPEEPKP